MGFILFLFIVLVGGGWLIGKILSKAIFGEKKEKYTFHSTHVHHHYHDHKNISIIDDNTKQKIFELKESSKK